MKKCKKNILLIFGFLLITAFLIVPYYGSFFRNPTIKLEKSGWAFWPYTPITGRHYIINWNALTTEIAVILLAAGFYYILFCVVLKKGNK